MYEPTLSPEEYILLYQLNAERLRLANPNALILHPGPMNRGVEISPEVADGPQSCVLEQVTNGIAVRMALLFLLMSGATEGGEGPVADEVLGGSSASPEKKESTHAAD
jgi:aspartate carbamoyltransferase catalytic subunit